MGFFPSTPAGTPDDGPTIEHTGEDPTVEEARDVYVVEEAGRRARAIAHDVFGGVGHSALTGLGLGGPFRGLLRLDVPFHSIESHHDREQEFLAAVADDALLSAVPLLFVVGPHVD